MFRSVAESARRRLRAALLCAVCLTSFASRPGEAQGTAATASGFELTRGVQRSLHRLQEAWLQWVSAFYRDNPALATEALKALEANSRQLGMPRLVDASLGAAAMAVQSARDGKFERAAWALAAAEQLDPGRPEAEFARAEVERLHGRRFAAAMASAKGLFRLVRAEEGALLLANLTFWFVAVLLVTAALFILVEIATKGSAVIADVHRWLRGRLTAGTAWLCAVILLLWPLALPAGPIWLLLYWSALLWGYESRSERWATAGIWLLAALGPWCVAMAEKKVAIAISPPMRAVSHFTAGRLYGSFFGDLEVLRGVVGDKPAAREILADVHRTLGQWEQARALYREVLVTEPERVPALINIGAFHFRKSDFALANQYFEQAARVQPPWAAAFYNLSLSFSETYQFEESQRALAQARAIDDDRVSEWVKLANSDRVFSFNGGLRRLDEFSADLDAVWKHDPQDERNERLGPPRRSWIAVLAVAALAVALHLARRGKPYAEPTPWLAWRSGAISRWLRAFVPALSQVELGEGGKAALSLLGLSAILLAPRIFSFGFELPLLFGLPAGLPWTLAISGLAIYLALCIRAELAEGE